MNQSENKIRFSTFRPEYLPNLEYFWYLIQCEKVVLTDHFQYTRRHVFSTSAPLNQQQVILRIPVKHDSGIMPVYQKQISYESNWYEKHYATIRHKYKKFPYAYLYLKEFEDMFLSRTLFLSEFLTELIIRISGWLKIKTAFFTASKMGYDPDNNKCLTDWAKKLNSNVYINSRSIFEQNFVDKKILNKNNLSTEIFNTIPDISIFRTYKDLSVLSFLFQFGPEAGFLIKQFQIPD